MYKVQNAVLAARLAYFDSKTPEERADAEEIMICAEKDWDRECIRLAGIRDDWHGH